MIYKSYAKVNIFLDVVSVYKNGYHGIKSIFLETDLFDTLDYSINETKTIEVTDKENNLPVDNLLTKAYQAYYRFSNRPKIGIHIDINKKIPIGGGMGGGSSNAAAILIILNKQNKNEFSKKELIKIAKTIGADVPYFIQSKTQKVFGYGELLSPIKTPMTHLNAIIVIPDEKVPTSDAYKYLDEMKLSCESYSSKKMFNNMVTGIQSNNIPLIIHSLYNKFEIPIFKQCPALFNIKNEMLKTGLDAVLMSGSGSTMMGFAINNEKINKSIDILKGKGYKIQAVSFRF